ncbi:uncharacterized protein LOC110807944 isoform X3 [Carica papaya]|uniref:uncharacterized protein LOC110807944 isoform X3 n=1 Tax=Carica papaya TaxID=3649 RepID=UPI000B8C89A9|nr:uncharacterized protein LOC110807944 isoform X3 [Carica papaya]
MDCNRLVWTGPTEALKQPQRKTDRVFEIVKLSMILQTNHALVMKQEMFQENRSLQRKSLMQLRKYFYMITESALRNVKFLRMPSWTLFFQDMYDYIVDEPEELSMSEFSDWLCSTRWSSPPHSPLHWDLSFSPSAMQLETVEFKLKDEGYS